MEAPVTSAYQRLPVTHVLTDTRSCTLWDLCCRSPGLQCHHCFSFPQLCCHISAPLLVLTTWNSPPLDSRLDSLCLCWQIPFLPVSFLRKFPLKLLLRGGFVLTHSLTRSLSRLRRRPSWYVSLLVGLWPTFLAWSSRLRVQPKFSHFSLALQLFIWNSLLPVLPVVQWPLTPSRQTAHLHRISSVKVKILPSWNILCPLSLPPFLCTLASRLFLPEVIHGRQISFSSHFQTNLF